MTLTQRERFIHYYTALSIGGMVKHACPNCIGEMLAGVLNKRCKSLTQTEADQVLADFVDESVGGCNVMDDIVDELCSIGNDGSAWIQSEDNRP